MIFSLYFGADNFWKLRGSKLSSFIRNFRYTYFAKVVKSEILLILLHFPRALYHFNIECEKMRTSEEETNNKFAFTCLTKEYI